MTRTVSGGIERLRAAMAGPVLGPDDPDFGEVRKVWNADIDRRPAVIARCTSTADVVAAVAFAQAEGLEISVRGGAHSMAGNCIGESGLMIDLGLLNGVTVDPVARRARVGGGALLGDLDRAAQEHGLGVPVGAISHTGVGGLTLGGGMGWLSRQAGLSIDNLLSAEVVLADGRVVRAADDENPDLFWALRGGGGNFGVVTEFEFRLHEVGPMVEFGLFFWGLDQGVEALRAIRAVVADLPRSCNVVIAALHAPPAPFIPEEHHFALGYALLVAGFGPAEEHRQVVERVRAACPPLVEHVEPMPYLALQQLLDGGNAWGMYGYEKGTEVEDLTDGVIDVFTEHVPQATSPMSVVFLYRLDQAFSEVAEDATAFGGGRSPRYSIFIIGLCPTPGLLPGERAWVRSFWEAFRPHAVGAGYVNSMTEQDQQRIQAAYGTKYDRLSRIKAEYDPGNAFHRNINIKPV